MVTRSVRLLGLTVVFALLLAACSGDDPVTTTALPGEEIDPAQAGDASHGCVDNVMVGATPNNLEFIGAHALAVDEPSGDVTLYIANFEIDPADPGTAPDGLTVFTLNVAPGPDGFAVGDELSVSTEAPGYTIAAQDGGVDTLGEPDAVGQLWITGVGDDLCGEISYIEGDLRLSGTFQATRAD